MPSTPTPLNQEQANLEILRMQLAQRMLRWVPDAGPLDSSLEGVTLIRSDSRSQCMSSVYEPSLAFMVQGSKSVQLGDREIRYGPLSYLVTSVHLPVLGQIIEASPEQPYLGIKLKIDPREVTELLLGMGDQAPESGKVPECPNSACGMCQTQMDGDMLQAVSRLVGLLDTPEHIPVLAPLARREILYRALLGELGPRMRRFAVSDGQASRVSRVIATLQDRYAEPLRISDLADEANMSESSLFHSFKQITRMTPLQFQKKLRLHEARRLMVSEGLEAASASYRVGYESPSHFSREYSRLFGAPPRADVSRLRGEQQGVPA
ncbi:AraC family transcriptional regulator [Parahaliea mediterranea]|uniref:AraC family transcriptional regulator n=1 Tax=Parahaliea mediterranea TaxID=651086 RepID=A0A939DFJ9_9GAMM|nr:AraC family transcriptional regulator [Parahaliea mediterranea]MBN7796612.1 AraC family transcriptional regulator [Parahaliea mediterranea]